MVNDNYTFLSPKQPLQITLSFFRPSILPFVRRYSLIVISEYIHFLAGLAAEEGGGDLQEAHQQCQGSKDILLLFNQETVKLCENTVTLLNLCAPPSCYQRQFSWFFVKNTQKLKREGWKILSFGSHQLLSNILRDSKLKKKFSTKRGSWTAWEMGEVTVTCTTKITSFLTSSRVMLENNKRSGNKALRIGKKKRFAWYLLEIGSFAAIT